MLATLLTIAGLLALVAAGIPLARRNKRVFDAHNDEMQAWAAAHGFSFTAEDDSQYDGYTFYPFGQPADRREAHRVITGTQAERTFAVYDFSFSGGNGVFVYFAMLVMQLPTTVPWLHVTERKHLSRHGDDDAVSTGDESFDSVYALFAKDQDYARSAVSATVRSGLPAQALTGMHIVDGKLFLWQAHHKHDVSLIEDRLRFAATVAAGLPAPS